MDKPLLTFRVNYFTEILTLSVSIIALPFTGRMLYTLVTTGWDLSYFDGNAKVYVIGPSFFYFLFIIPYEMYKVLKKRGTYLTLSPHYLEYGRSLNRARIAFKDISKVVEGKRYGGNLHYFHIYTSNVWRPAATIRMADYKFERNEFVRFIEQYLPKNTAMDLVPDE